MPTKKFENYPNTTFFAITASANASATGFTIGSFMIYKNPALAISMFSIGAIGLALTVLLLKGLYDRRSELKQTDSQNTNHKKLDPINYSLIGSLCSAYFTGLGTGVLCVDSSDPAVLVLAGIMYLGTLMMMGVGLWQANEAPAEESRPILGA